MAGRPRASGGFAGHLGRVLARAGGRDPAANGERARGDRGDFRLLKLRDGVNREVVKPGLEHRD